ncbi:hypothetical protein [Streptomyces lateritius]|uniref:hypothetical protein n=1 Tax=Streptomyces lateritius TaxID=67313 RepID=UPI001C8BF128|nr:hypothetical protein [Streptomyces lateritius]MBX9421237.1 hypothetical protein [Streptomyces lateritius]
MDGKSFSRRTRRRGLLLSGGLALTVAAATLTAASPAQAQYGPYTCASGLVWREAVSGDRVCVSPQWRTKTWEENRLGPSNVQPGGGAYGPDTCKQGFVWRETRPSDHVCVDPRSRADNRLANAHAATGYANPGQLPANGTHASWTQYGSRLAVSPAHLAFQGYEPGRGYHSQMGNYGSSYGSRLVTPQNCRQSSSRTMYVLAVDVTTGTVSNAGRVAVPLCLYP